MRTPENVAVNPEHFGITTLRAERSHKPGSRGQRERSAFFVLISFTSILLMGRGVGVAQPDDLGIFTNHGSVGQTPPGVAAHYDAAKGEYRITGGGANVWGTTDAFYFVWKKASGDMALTADVQWVGTSSAEHRKALLMVRHLGEHTASTQIRNALERVYRHPEKLTHDIGGKAGTSEFADAVIAEMQSSKAEVTPV